MAAPLSTLESAIQNIISDQNTTALTFRTEIFSSTESLSQPWLPQLTQMINESFFVQSNFRTDAIRLESDTQISEELGPNGFTAVAFAYNDECQSTEDGDFEIIGTASVKDWVDDGVWKKYDATQTETTEEINSGESFVCEGDYEVAVVAIPPGPKYRKRGIADQLVKLCEKQIVRRLNDRGSDAKGVKAMVKVNPRVNGLYWRRKGFITAGVRWCPKGTWGQLQDFTMWAMSKDLSMEELI